MIYVTTPIMTCLWVWINELNKSLQFTDLQNNSTMNVLKHLLNIEIHNMRNLGQLKKI